MSNLSFTGANYFGQDGRFQKGGFSVEDGRFAAVGATGEGVDLEGAYVIPGLLDIHTHGNSGFDFSCCTEEQLAVMAKTHARAGVAGFCPTSMTLPEEELVPAFQNAARLKKQPAAGAAQVLGVNMEGPFLSPKRKGAQNDAHLRAPDKPFFDRLQQAAEGCIRLVDLAPELPGAPEFIRAAKGEVILSLAHSDADYDKAAEAFEAGVTHMTHLFNAMPGLNHRTPGPIAAAFDRDDVYVELIADGIHLHPSIVRVSFALFGARRICLISDSMEACGMPDGSYQLGGQAVRVSGPRATLADGTIAGSVTPVFRCMQNAIEWGVPKEDAVRAASLTPAQHLGLEQDFGAIADGRQASFVVTDQDFNIRQVYLRGERLEV